jgi:hypothetical protein
MAQKFSAAIFLESKSPISLLEKWGFHDLAILAPPRVERRKPAGIGKKINFTKWRLH